MEYQLPFGMAYFQWPSSKQTSSLKRPKLHPRIRVQDLQKNGVKAGGFLFGRPKEMGIADMNQKTLKKDIKSMNM